MKELPVKHLQTLRRKFTAEERKALRFRRLGDLMNYLRSLKEARRLRIAYLEYMVSNKNLPGHKSKVTEESDHLEEGIATSGNYISDSFRSSSIHGMFIEDKRR